MKPTSIAIVATVVGVVLPWARQSGAQPATPARVRAVKESPTPRARKSVQVLDSLVKSALRQHPSLQQIEARIRVAKTKSSQVKAYPDPVMSIGLMNMPFSPVRFNATPMTGLQVTLTQMIPWPSKLSLAGKVARSRVKVTAASLKEARLRLSTMVRATALMLAFVDAEALITKQHGMLIDGLIKVADVRYRVNKGLLQDLLKAKLARSMVVDLLQKIARRRER